MPENKQVGEPQTGFMQRWSQRKLQVQQEDQLKKENEQQLKTNAELLPVAQEEKPKTDADMPPIESLTEESDYSGFMSSGVSEALRKLALRKLFHMPSMNIVDDLDDYAEDFTSFVPLGDLIPHDMKRMIDREKARLQEKLEGSDQEQAGTNVDTSENSSEQQSLQTNHGDKNVDIHDVEIAGVDETDLVDEQDMSEEI